jgi:hypothetical protein
LPRGFFEASTSQVGLVILHHPIYGEALMLVSEIVGEAVWRKQHPKPKPLPIPKQTKPKARPKPKPRSKPRPFSEPKPDELS